MFGPNFLVLKKDLSDYWRSFIRLLYPAHCLSCRVPLLIDETYLCSSCHQTIQLLKVPLCIRCASPLPPYGSYRSLCGPCSSHRPYYDRGFALVRYEEPVKTVFHHIKFGKKIWLLRLFAPLVEQCSNRLNVSDYDMLIPVPLDSKRQRERGFNQAQAIAGMLKRSNPNRNLGIREPLVKWKRTLPQSQLTRHERLKNVEGVFSVRKRSLVHGKHILLVDDIFTTGSTINECAKLLKEEGAERVDFFTIARS